MIGIANICLLIFLWLVFTTRLSGALYFDSEGNYLIITVTILRYIDQLNLLNAFIIIITILFLFTLEVRKALIIGIIGFAFYLLNEISIIMIVSSRYLFFRVLVMVFYCSLQIILSFKHFKPSLKEIESIKKIILEIRRKSTLIKIMEITEKSTSGKNIVKDVLNEMIHNRTINADYFKRSKTVAFFS